MPDIQWTEAERKSFWRMMRSGLWTALIVIALIFALNLFQLAGGGLFGILLLLVYAAAMWVVVYKIVRMRWPG